MSKKCTRACTLCLTPCKPITVKAVGRKPFTPPSEPHSGPDALLSLGVHCAWRYAATTQGSWLRLLDICHDRSEQVIRERTCSQGLPTGTGHNMQRCLFEHDIKKTTMGGLQRVTRMFVMKGLGSSSWAWPQQLLGWSSAFVCGRGGNEGKIAR